MSNYNIPVAATPLYTSLLGRVHKYDEADTLWRMMVHDHKDWIKTTGTYMTLTPELIQEYEYCPEEFLVEQCNVTSGITWILLFINDIPSKMRFDTTLTYLYIPNADYISELYMTYKAIMANRKKRL